MINKIHLICFSAMIAFTLPTAQASTRTDMPLAPDMPLDRASVGNPSSEKKCLEAFVSSKFVYAHRLCLSLAQRGMRDAQLVTGLMYAFGEGIEKNTELAKLWLNEAARNGSIEAIEVLDGMKMTE